MQSRGRTITLNILVDTPAREGWRPGARCINEQGATPNPGSISPSQTAEREGRWPSPSARPVSLQEQERRLRRSRWRGGQRTLDWPPVAGDRGGAWASAERLRLEVRMSSCPECSVLDVRIDRLAPVGAASPSTRRPGVGAAGRPSIYPVRPVGAVRRSARHPLPSVSKCSPHPLARWGLMSLGIIGLVLGITIAGAAWLPADADAILHRTSFFPCVIIPASYPMTEQVPIIFEHPLL